MKNRKEQRTSLDSGYSWVILVASTVIYAIFAGWCKTFGILYVEFINYYGTTSGNTAWVIGVASLLNFALGPVSNHLCEVYSFRSVVMCGGILFAAGNFISAFVIKMEVLYLTIGIISGSGIGFLFAPASTIVSFYFEKRRGLANAVMISGSGIATFSFPFFYSYLLDKYGLQGTLIVLSAVISNICVCSALYRQPLQLMSIPRNKCNECDERGHSNLLQTSDPNVKLKLSNDRNEDGDKLTITTGKQCSKLPNFRLHLTKIFDFSLFLNINFRLLAFAYTANTFAFISIFIVLPSYIQELGFEKTKAAVALSVAGSTEIVSKLFFGWLVDLKYFKTRHILCMSFVISGIAAIIIPFFQTFYAIVIYAAIVGIFAGTFVTLTAVALLDYIPIIKLPKGFGLISLCMSFGAFLTQPVAGWIEDVFGSWTYSFRYIGAMHLLAAVFLCIHPCMSKCMKDSTTTSNKISTDDYKDNSLKANNDPSPETPLTGVTTQTEIIRPVVDVCTRNN